MFKSYIYGEANNEARIDFNAFKDATKFLIQLLKEDSAVRNR